MTDILKRWSGFNCEPSAPARRSPTSGQTQPSVGSGCRRMATERQRPGSGERTHPIEPSLSLSQQRGLEGVAPQRQVQQGRAADSCHLSQGIGSRSHTTGCIPAPELRSRLPRDEATRCHFAVLWHLSSSIHRKHKKDKTAVNTSHRRRLFELRTR